MMNEVLGNPLQECLVPFTCIRGGVCRRVVMPPTAFREVPSVTWSARAKSLLPSRPARRGSATGALPAIGIHTLLRFVMLRLAPLGSVRFENNKNAFHNPVISINGSTRLSFSDQCDPSQQQLSTTYQARCIYASPVNVIFTLLLHPCAPPRTDLLVPCLNAEP